MWQTENGSTELTTEHYKMLLGLDESWCVDLVDFDPDQKRVTVKISHGGGTHGFTAIYTHGYNQSPHSELKRVPLSSCPVLMTRSAGVKSLAVETAARSFLVRKLPATPLH